MIKTAPVHPDGHASIAALLGDAMLQFRDELACLELDRKKERTRLTYAQFHAEARRVARRLELMGYGAGDRVAIIMSNQPAWLVTAFAAFMRGMVLVPLDWRAPTDDQVALLRHANPRLLVTESHLFSKIFAAATRVGWEPDLPVMLTEAVGPLPEGLARWEDPAPDDAPPTQIARTRDDVACIVYTSGTSGRPRGVMLTHGAYLSQLAALMEVHPLHLGDRYFSVLPTNHAIDFMVGFVGPLASGATVLHQKVLRPETIVDTMRLERPTHMAVVPLLLTAFEKSLDDKLGKLPRWQKAAVDALIAVNAGLTERRPLQGLSRVLLKPIHDAFGGRLRVIFAGGALVDRKRAERFYALGLPVVIGYGLTEACTVATVQDLAPFRADSVGRPLAGIEVAIRDAAPDGVGEVFVRGPTVMQGYLDDPDATAEVLSPDGWLRTGDLGRVDASGHLHLVGRKKDMIVTAGGKNIYPEDVEAAFSGIGDELVVFAENFVWPRDGLTGERLVAVARAADWADARARIQQANRKLPEARRVWGLVRAPEPFPRTASMKVKRHELARALGASLPRDAIEELVVAGPSGVPGSAR
ncbi:MAG: AMP-binding protein [Deltaproteobacteria bacterium]|nr:AMP-binding protein [Deltaproteobacteria bacterium]